MPDWDAMLSEMRAMRVSLDRLAAVAVAEQAKAELLPVWSCGHRHASRTQAVACNEAQRETTIEAAE